MSFQMLVASTPETHLVKKPTYACLLHYKIGSTPSANTAKIARPWSISPERGIPKILGNNKHGIF
jgi:hypothetical protein